MKWKQNIIDADTGKEIAKGEIIMVTYDYREGQTIPIPPQWRGKIMEFEGLKV